MNANVVVTSEQPAARRERAKSSALLASVGLIAASALAYEILLTRIFAIVHWPHLVAIAISLALLGYGASGTFLVLFERPVRTRPALAYTGNAILFGLSAVACVAMAQRLTFDPQGLSWDLMQIIPLSATFLLLAIPFFAAANCIGLALIHARRDIPRVYGTDLVGAGVGAVIVLLGLSYVAVDALLVSLVFISVLAAALGARAFGGHLLAVTATGLALSFSVVIFIPHDVSPAAYKDLYRALATMGGQPISETHGIGGVVSVVRNRQIPTRMAPGLSLQSTVLPPQQMAVFVDGDQVGTLPDVADSGESTDYFSQLLSALPYRLGAPASRVAVLNAGTGYRVQQAVNSGASAVTAVEPNPQLVSLVCRLYAAGCDRQRADWQVQSARAFVASSPGDFDLITLDLPGDAAGLDALRIDHSATVEAFADYLDHLTANGILVVEGPTRTPPGLSIRMLATARDALTHSEVGDPRRQIVMLRGWQRFLLLIFRSPVSDADLEATREFSRSLGFDLVWLPGMRSAEANRYQQLRTALYHDAARVVLNGDLTSGPTFRFRPVTDDTPYPHLSTGWREAAGGLLIGTVEQRSQLDVGVLVGVVTFAVAGLAASMFILLPLLALRRQDDASWPSGLRIRSVAFFALIGGGFLVIEIAWIDQLQLFLGHPVYATTAVLACFLVFAGFGSLWSQRQPPHSARRRLHTAVGVIAVACLLYVTLVPTWLTGLADQGIMVRIGTVVILLAPLAFAMGIPFPTALQYLAIRSPGLVPWAWGINGSASVIAAAGTPLLGSEIGFSGLVLVAASSYLLLPLIGLLGSRA